MHPNRQNPRARRLAARRIIDALEPRRLFASLALDTTFGGGDGHIAFDYSTVDTSSYPQQLIRSTTTGRLVTVGGSQGASSSSGAGAVSAFTADGAIDTTFGGGDGMAEIGIVASDFVAGDIASDGKILATGYDQFVLGQMLVARFDANGVPDTTFGPGGYRTFGGSGPDQGEVVKALAGGKVLVGGAHDFAATRSDMAVWRLNENGTPDTTFSGDGLATYDFWGVNDDIYDMIALPDGSVLGVGRTVYTGFGESPAIVKFTSTGALDTTFRNVGYYDYYAEFNVGRFESVQRLSDGKLLLTGIKDGLPMLARMSANGVLDTTFGGGDGWLTLPGQFKTIANHPAVMPDGAMIIASEIDPAGTAYASTAFLRVLSNGAVDSAFGTGGSVVFDAPAGNNARPVDTLIDPQGRVHALSFGFDSAVVMRLTESTAPVVTATFVNGVVTVTGTDNADDVTIRNNFSGSIVVQSGTVSWSFPLNGVDLINVDLKGGSDSLTVEQVLFTPINAVGGAGTSDLIFVETSNGNDDEATVTRGNVFGGGNDVTFDASFEVVFVDLMAGADTVALNLSGTSGPTSFVIYGGAVDDRYNLNAPVANGVTLSLQGEDGADSVALGSATLATVAISNNRTLMKFAGSTGQVQLSSVETITGNIAPRVTLSAFEFETAQAINFNFENVDSASIGIADLAIQRLDAPGTYIASLLNASVGGASFTQTARWRSFRTPTSFNSVPLPDGIYRATIAAGQLTDLLGQPNAQAIELEFHVLAGDANRDRTTNFDDLLVLAKNFNTSGRTFSQGDFNYSGTVDFDDLLILAKNFNKSVSVPPTIASVALAGSTKTRRPTATEIIG